MTDGIEPVDHCPVLPARDREGHKGNYGRVLVVGGSRGMLGAPAMTALAALRGGAGLACMALPECVQLAVAPMCPYATSVPLPCDDRDALSPSATAALREWLDWADVLAVGPGWGEGLAQQMILRAILAQTKPVVLDADGLNSLVSLGDWGAVRQCPLVLTPHPGEMARLGGISVRDVQGDRQGVAVAAARDWADRQTVQGASAVLVLKGAGTVVTDGRRVYVNATGNPGMASGGAGDVLTGLIAALIGQKLSPFDAAVLGAHIHGLAGDLAANVKGEVSLVAGDIIDMLGEAFLTEQS